MGEEGEGLTTVEGDSDVLKLENWGTRGTGGDAPDYPPRA